MKYDVFLMNEIVFDYINTAKDLRITALFDFLRNQNYPVYPSWVFYFLGRHSKVDEFLLKKMKETGFNTYDELIYGELYYWTRYLERSFYEFKKDYCDDFSENNTLEKIPNDEKIYEIYFSKGWDEVDGEIENQVNTQFHELSKNDNVGEPKITTQEECEACGEHPCMCSDPERTSSVLDY